MTEQPPNRSRALILHPFFFGLFPLFSLLSANMVWAGFNEVWLPAAVVIAATTLLWLALWPLLPQPHKRGLALSLFWLPFYGYSLVVDTLRDFFSFRELLSPGAVAAIAVLTALIAAGALWGLRKSPWSFKGVTTALNRISALILMVALASCALALVRQAQAQPSVAMPVPVDKALDPAALPNIYFIVADSYPRSDYLKSYFGIENTPFLDQLRARGFYIAERSRSNYPNTLPSLASTLNMDYLDNAIATEGWEDARYPSLLSQIRGNMVVPMLRSVGYEFVAIASGVFPTELGEADRFIHPGGWRPTEYHQQLIDATPIRSVLNRMKKKRFHHRVPFVFDTLETVRREEKPMFVFAHLMAPHLPHAYDVDGNVLLEFPPYKPGWRQMTDFVNRRLLAVVDAIQQHEPNSVIIIEGDHGPRTTWQSTFSNELLPWEGPWEEYVRDRCANLSTFYFPDRQYDGLLYPEITPVNTFRVIFNKYFGTQLDLLEDVTYLSPQHSTEIVRVKEVY